MKMSNEAYDFWKKMVEVVLPAAGACYYGLSQIWNWPYAEHVVGTISVICTFLGTILFNSNKAYKAQLKEEELRSVEEAGEVNREELEVN